MFQFFKKLISPFSKIKSVLGQKIKILFSKANETNQFEDLEQLLYEADLGAEFSIEIVNQLRSFCLRNIDATPEDILHFVKTYILSFFPNPISKNTESPHIILIVGVNGSGKTTTIAKLAKKYSAEYKKVLIGACDTFRAAAVEQLQTWATKTGAELVKAQPKSDPSAVAFDTIQAALARKADVVLIDTAGRLHNKTELMHELAKIAKTIKKLVANAPHETLLVIDATLGQNALDQAKTFHEFTPISGIVLTKLDGSAKGGIAAAITKQLNIPILWAGLGESADDLVPFNAKEYVEALFQ